MTKNPKWTRDELILALELYTRIDTGHTSDKNPEVIKLSETLNALPIHPCAGHGEKFRNANGVYMKLCNFLRLDSSYKGVGLERGSKLDEIIWKEFFSDPTRLKATAAAIHNGASFIPPPSDEEELAIDEEFPEGRLLTQVHKRRERNPIVVRKKKKNIIATTGTLACEVCGFDFQKTYGFIGQGFAECHHCRPLFELTGLQRTSIKDLAIVCANCHRMLHRIRPWKTINEFKELIRH